MMSRLLSKGEGVVVWHITITCIVLICIVVWVVIIHVVVVVAVVLESMIVRIVVVVRRMDSLLWLLCMLFNKDLGQVLQSGAWGIRVCL